MYEKNSWRDSQLLREFTLKAELAVTEGPSGPVVMMGAREDGYWRG